MGRFQSTKVVSGFSTVFRQHRAADTHCKFIHGYAISFKLWFAAEELDHRQWCVDFGFLKRSRTQVVAGGRLGSIGDWFKWLFDHTVVIAADDPELLDFEALATKGVLQLRVVPFVGCERFAELVCKQLEKFLEEETKGRVKIVRVECFEHSRNSAIYEPA